MWEIEVTDEFEAWWRELTPALQEALDQRLRLLAARGPASAGRLSTRWWALR
jgi:hypothetical protein